MQALSLQSRQALLLDNFNVDTQKKNPTMPREA